MNALKVRAVKEVVVAAQLPEPDPSLALTTSHTGRDAPRAWTLATRSEGRAPRRAKLVLLPGAEGGARGL